MRPRLLLRATFAALVAVLSSAALRAQTIFIDDASQNGGTTFAFTGTAPRTSLHIYSVSALRERGICAGATLTDLAILPFLFLGGTSSGTYAAPQALVQIGHMVGSPQVGAWSANLIAPITVHGLASGPYTFPWTVGTFVPLPGFGSAGFTWDGLRDIGILYGTPSSATGGFYARSSVERFHSANGFLPPPGVGTENIGAMKVRLTFTPGGPCAVKSTTGTGCYRGAWSFYEMFGDLINFDLSGSAANPVVLRASPTPAGFAVAAAPSAWFSPTGSPLIGNNGIGPMDHDAFSRPLNLPFSFPFPGGFTRVIHAAANGFVLLGPTANPTSDPTPSVDELLGDQPRLLPLWANLDPTPSAGTARGTFFDIEPNNQAVYVTWNECLDGRGPPSTFATSITVQCVLRSSGEFEFRYRGVTANPSRFGTAMVGWSPGASTGPVDSSAVDPGPFDLSQALPFSTNGPDILPLTLDANAPAFGASWRLTIQPITVVPLALVFFGTGSQPGPDLGAIGAPGCRAYSTADITSISLPAISGVATATATVPVNPQLLGIAFTAQASTFTIRNPLGLVTSNGMQFVVGN